MPKTKAPKGSMVTISIHLPKDVLREIDELVAKGRYPSRSELIRTAVQDMLNEVLYQQQQRREVVVDA